MLFFKQIKTDKLNEKAFKTLYERECHICRLTLQIISLLESSKDDMIKLLNKLDIPLEDYNRLKTGDYCNPSQVKQLCLALNIKTPEQSWKCPRD